MENIVSSTLNSFYVLQSFCYSINQFYTPVCAPTLLLLFSSDYVYKKSSIDVVLVFNMKMIGYTANLYIHCQCAWKQINSESWMK